MILVVGGTGRLGSSVVTDLLAKGHAVRVLTRGKHALPSASTGAEHVTGSVCDPVDVSRAMDGVDVVVSAVTGFPSASPATVDVEGARVLVRAAEAGRSRLVILSVAGAAADSPMELFRAKYAAEQELARSDLDWTIVRPEAFADLWLDLLTRTAGRRHRPLVFGPGLNPMGWVAVGDVTALTVAAVENGSWSRRTLTLSGPEKLTLTELAARVMAAHEWPGTPRHLPVGVLRLAARLPGLPGRQASAALAMELLPGVDDDARQALPQLPRTSVGALLQRTEVQPT